MDLLVGIRKTGGTIGIRATCGICRERRRVQQREQHGHKHRRGKRTEEAHAHSFGGAGRRVETTANRHFLDDFRIQSPRTTVAHGRRSNCYNCATLWENRSGHTNQMDRVFGSDRSSRRGSGLTLNSRTSASGTRRTAGWARFTAQMRDVRSLLAR